MLESNNRKYWKEKFVEKLLLACAGITILTTLSIILVLVVEAVGFFKVVPVMDFLTGTVWKPSFDPPSFGVQSLFAGTLLTTLIAMIVALPLGLTIAIYLSEYASPKLRAIVKPSLEILAAIPTVVYGYFAITIIAPLIKAWFFPDMPGQNALSAGIVMGIMILPLIVSLTEDALHAVPKTLREGSFAMGATKFQTVFRVIIPAALSGIAVAVILAISRAIGETMIVAIAAGQQPNFTFDPTESILTVTAAIVQLESGDASQFSIEYKTLYAVGITLFLFTFILNQISFYIKRKFIQEYR